MVPGHVPAQASSADYLNVINPDEMKYGISTLNHYLTPITPAVAVVRCDLMVEHHLTHIESVFAGICYTANQKAVEVCGDTAAGWFALSGWDSPIRPQNRMDLISFADRDCPGGG